jgi:hypothetical protein
LAKSIARALIPLSIFSNPEETLSRLQDPENSMPTGFQIFSSRYPATVFRVVRSRISPRRRGVVVIVVKGLPRRTRYLRLFQGQATQVGGNVGLRIVAVEKRNSQY